MHNLRITAILCDLAVVSFAAICDYACCQMLIIRVILHLSLQRHDLENA